MSHSSRRPATLAALFLSASAFGALVEPIVPGNSGLGALANVVAPAAAITSLSNVALPLPINSLAAPTALPAAVDAPAPAIDVLRDVAAPLAAQRTEAAVGARFDGTVAARSSEADFVVNDESVKIFGRAAEYYKEVRRMVDLYGKKIDLSESVHVMDDSYGDVVAKISAIEAIAGGRGLAKENTQLDKSMMFVDGILRDGKKNVVVHTQRVYFHHAANPQSEIREGIRRVDGVLRESVQNFARGGKAESRLGRIDEVELVFDARGYPEIKAHLLQRAAEIHRETKGRVRLRMLDDLVTMPTGTEPIRARLNDLVGRYKDQGVAKIIEGVIYSRYVGLLLELKTLEHYHLLGYKILQSGRELFDANGLYISELDAVVKSPQGRVILVEAKSARIALEFDDMLQEKIIYKLDTYKRSKGMLDTMIGEPFDEVVFSMDFGLGEFAEPRTDKRGKPRPDDVLRLDSMRRLRAMEPELSRRYGFPVSFLFH